MVLPNEAIEAEAGNIRTSMHVIIDIWVDLALRVFQRYCSTWTIAFPN